MIILALVVLGGFTMCGKNEVVAHEEDPWTALTGDSPITFTSVTSGPVTKTTSPLPTGTTFGVFASFQQGEIGSGIPASGSAATFTPNYMYNEDVHYNAGPSYSYAPIKYWPNNQENTISFWAYSPYTTDTEGFLKIHGTGTDYSNTSTCIPDIHFTSDGKTDLMVTHLDESAPYVVKDLSKPAVSGTVDLLFHHLLSRVVFHFVKVEDDEDVYEVRITNVSIQGIYLTADHPGDPSGSWSDWTNSGSLPVYADLTPDDLTDNLVVPKAPGTSAETDSDRAVMPIPQTLTERDNAAIVISYAVFSSSDGSLLNSKQGVFPIHGLHDGWVHPAGWEQNYQYTYNVSIKPTSDGNPIVFSASISPWSDENDPDNYGYIPIVQ